MILKSLHVENIRSYIDEKIEFPEGSIMLSGDIGAGKSTILLAIEFGLFGFLRPHLTGETLLRHGTKEGSVTLKFEVDSRKVFIKRVIKKQKQSIIQDAGFIMKDGIKTDATPTELKIQILELLGYPSELLTKSKLIFRYTVYTPQEEMRQILYDERETRLDMLRRVFGVDKYKRIIENSSNFARSLRAEIKNLEQQISGLPGKRKEKTEQLERQEEAERKKEVLELQLTDVQQLIANKKEDISRIEDMMHAWTELVKQIEVQNMKLEEYTERFQVNKETIAQLEKESASIKSKLEGFVFEKIDIPKDFVAKEEEAIHKELEDEERELMEIEKDILTTKERILHLDETLKNLKEQIGLKTKRFEELDAKRSALSILEDEVKVKQNVIDERTALEKEVQHYIAKIASVEEQQRRSKKMIADIALLKECPVCLQSVSEDHKLHIKSEEEKNISAKQDVKEMLNEKHRSLNERWQRTKQLLEELNDKEKALEGLRASITGLELSKEEAESLQERHSKLSLELIAQKAKKIDPDFEERKTKNIENKKILMKMRENSLKQRERAHLKNALLEKEKLLEKLIGDNERVKGSIRNSNAEKIRLQQALKEHDGLHSRYESAKAELEKLLVKERQVEIAMTECSKDIESIQQMLKMIKDSIDKLTSLESKLERIRLLREWIENHFSLLVANMEKHVLLRAHNEFDELFQHWFSALIEDETISVRLDEQFSPLIMQNGYETDALNLSGGEKTSVALAYRLALNTVINQIIGEIRTKDILILDEPTDGFSSYQLDKIKDVLEELQVRQIFIVSHESKMESFVDHVLHVQKNEHISQVTSSLQ
ncbi:MAG: hypothetical protein ACE5DM_00505 [Candidatus Nanoarchaeia archaeon]